METFKSLKVGEIFRFASELEWWSLGMKNGPFRKISIRKYTTLDGIQSYQVGTIHAEILRGN